MKKGRRNFYVAVYMLALFLLWTIAIKFIDIQAIGPCESTVGFATLNNLAHTITGVHMELYNITDWLGLVPIMFVIAFGILGLIQWIQRKHILKVDYSILILGIFYIVVIAVYVVFEVVTVNFRPVLINNYLEKSYPFSTTMLVMTVMPTVIIQFKARIKNSIIKNCINTLIVAFIMFMVIARFISGVHWITDIIGGAMLSVGLVQMYVFINNLKEN